MASESLKNEAFHTPVGRATISRLTGSSKKLRQPFKSPFRKEISKPTDDEATTKKEVDELQTKCAELDKTIRSLQDEGYDEAELQQHIMKLHEYNEMKDIGQMVLGKLAVHLGLTTRDLYDRYELDLND